MSRTHESSRNVHRYFQSEWWWTFQGYYFLFPHYRFQCRCRFLGCLHLYWHSRKLSPPPLPLYPMNFLHCSPSRKYFRYFGSLFLFLLNRLATFWSWLNPYRFLTPQVHLETHSAHEVWLRHRYEVVINTYSSSSAMFVTRIIRLFRSNCPRGVQNKISLEAAIQKHALPKPLGKDDSKHLLFLVLQPRLHH